jgi:hypothetical protein
VILATSAYFTAFLKEKYGDKLYYVGPVIAIIICIIIWGVSGGVAWYLNKKYENDWYYIPPFIVFLIGCIILMILGGGYTAF